MWVPRHMAPGPVLSWAGAHRLRLFRRRVGDVGPTGHPLPSSRAHQPSWFSFPNSPIPVDFGRFCEHGKHICYLSPEQGMSLRPLTLFSGTRDAVTLPHLWSRAPNTTSSKWGYRAAPPEITHRANPRKTLRHPQSPDDSQPNVDTGSRLVSAEGRVTPGPREVG